MVKLYLLIYKSLFHILIFPGLEYPLGYIAIILTLEKGYFFWILYYLFQVPADDSALSMIKVIK